MSDEKVCPFRKDMRIVAAMYEEPQWLPCLREKCAMWRAAIVLLKQDGSSAVPGEYPGGHCGLAGKP